jgi:hypothetical protein
VKRRNDGVKDGSYKCSSDEGSSQGCDETKTRCAQCSSNSYPRGTDHHCGILGTCVHDKNR